MKFTIADFKKVLHGFETETLNIWFARGYIEIENLNPGRGRSRTFTWPEAVKVGVMCHLGVTGRGPKITSEIAKIIGKRAEGTRPEDWIPDILDEDLDQCVFFYQVKIVKNKTVIQHSYLKRKDISHEALTIEGSFFDCDHMMERLAQELLSRKNLK